MIKKSKELLEITQDILRGWIDTYMIKHIFFRSETLAKSLLELYYDYPYHEEGYNAIIKNWTKKISKILKRMETEGILDIYTKNRRGYLYRKIKYYEEVLQ